MIVRDAKAYLEQLSHGFPVLAITGPRQSGKTTLAKAVFPDKPYISLENPEHLEFAQRDPKRFFAQFSARGAIIDEIQREPALFSWLQGITDERKRMGDFVVTGSAQFELLASITQSLAGRVGRLELLPLSLKELAQTPAKELPTERQVFHQIDDLMFNGSYPALYDQARTLAPRQWYTSYISTYVERDVRQLLNVRDLGQFQRFIRLCAARSGQLLNLQSLGTDAGVSAQTARNWISVLEASYILRLVEPYFVNFGKRIVKAPKLYFLDTGLLCFLLGIHDSNALSIHSTRGAVFETWAIAETFKQRFNKGDNTSVYFWRSSQGLEIDLLVETARGLCATEIKSGATFTSEWLNALLKFPGNLQERRLVYGGSENFERQSVQVESWQSFGKSD
jgi:uncharacterized protein